MGNEQSVDGEPVPETGLRLSTLCRYQAEPDNEEGIATFSWFQSSTDVSGLALRGAHRWGYILSHVGGQRLFKDTRQRFFVLLDHYMCFFDSHAPEARMKGSIDLDKGHCHLELLPRPPETVDLLLHGSTGGGEGDDHRVEVTRRTDEFSMVLCFSSADSLSDWMKSIFDVQQRKATFSRLGHGRGGAGDHDGNHRGNDGCDEPSLRGSLLGGRYTNSGGMGIAGNARGRSRGRGGRRRGRRRGTLDSSPPPPRPPRRPHREGRGVPSSWADAADEDGGSTIIRDRRGEGGPREEGRGERSPPAEDPLRPSSSPSSSSSVWLGKASERLAGLPRGGRAAGGDGGIHGGGSGGGSNLDEYGAFTTARASIYEGWTRGLQPHGWGRMIFANGDCVEGWWEHDVLQGSGATYKSRCEGWTFTGGYAAGQRDGPGRLVTAQGDAWECEWRRGVVAPASRGTHVAAAGGEVYQGVCGPSPDDPAVPCRAGQGRLRRRNGEQVDTRFRAGRAVDGAKGVVRFRNGAIFFGELREARPHGYGELYLSSVKAAGDRRSSSSSSSRARKPSGSLAELAEMARDVLWYKGDFRLGKPHGAGLIKFKDPVRQVTAAASGAAAAAAGRGFKRGGGVLIGSPAQGVWAESKGADGDEEREVKAEVDGKGGIAGVDGGAGGGGGGRGRDEEGEGEDAVPLASGAAHATDECMMEEEEGEEDESSTDSDEEDEDEDEEEMEEEGGEQEERGERRFNRSRGRGRVALRDGGEDQATPGAATRRRGQRPPADDGGGGGGGGGSGGGGGGGGGADMEYEAEFVDGVMVRHDASQLRLAALRFGRAEIRRLHTLLRKEEDAMSRLRVRGLCLLCNVEEMNALLVGCRHHVLCCGCAGRVENCPLCGERIGKVVKTYST